MCPVSLTRGILEEEEGLCKKSHRGVGSGREKETLHSTTRKRINRAKRS